MISVEAATQIVLEHAITLPTESVALEKALGRLLREDLVADRDFPPFDRVTMDGIAIDYKAFAAGTRQFPIAGVGAAGAPQARLADAQQCIEIMTGAMLPAGADTVIRYEDLKVENGTATVLTEELRQGQNVHRQGVDRSRGAVVVEAGAALSPAELGVAATVGKARLQVARPPRAIIISSGDELVEVATKPAPYQIRKSNVYRLLATLKGWGMEADTAHLFDDRDVIREKLAPILAAYQVVIMSGGVSKGKFDYFPEILAELGVEKLFHRVRQRPGKPFWFGKAPSGAVVFALPGNPVSSFMCTHRYFYPWLRACLGQSEAAPPHAILAEPVDFRPDLTYFVQVNLRHTVDGRTIAHPIQGHGSGDLANLARTDAFLELPRGRDRYPAGEAFRIIPFR